MKGVILAGGLATRLRPLTWVTNKHLLPIYNKPMIYYPLEALASAGIKEVLLLSSPDHSGHFANLLKGGEDFNMRIYYGVQKNPKGGIADGISYAEEFTKNEKIIVVLGDNIFNVDLRSTVDKFKKQSRGAIVYGVKMSGDANQYGVIEMDNSGKVVSIEEKPQNPKSDIIQTGIYLYDERVFDFIRKLTPSARGELEVTDLNNYYLKEGTLSCELLDWWVDAGTSFDELLRANNLVAQKVGAGEL
ncbi:sugar phosphate nucleotidyltransferase [Patescibacteria group bacterium]|nr:sugar phosphate nucleotidyltransferase [Patescibacteria group bacterium]MCL5010160.1 sugar phosphate nucleotidyltransferase [Patescibacteria group bacterium]